MKVRHGQLGLAPRLTLALKSHRGKAGGRMHYHVVMEVLIEGVEIAGIASGEQARQEALTIGHGNPLTSDSS